MQRLSHLLITIALESRQLMIHFKDGEIEANNLNDTDKLTLLASNRT